MATPQQLAAEAVHRLPVIIQELPDLRYTDNDWTSKSGRQIAIGSIPVSGLAELCEVDRLEPGNQDGYQRVPTQNRISALRPDLQTNRVDLPTAILTNLRDFDADRHLDGTGPHFELGSEHISLMDNRLVTKGSKKQVRGLGDGEEVPGQAECGGAGGIEGNRFLGAFCSVQADPCPHCYVGRRGARGRGYEGCDIARFWPCDGGAGLYGGGFGIALGRK